MKIMLTVKKILLTSFALILISINGISDDIGIPAKKFYSATVDTKDNIWFLTELGIVSYEGQKWKLHDTKMKGRDLKDIAFDYSIEGTGFWIATGSGITSLKSPGENDSPEIVVHYRQRIFIE